MDDGDTAEGADTTEEVRSPRERLREVRRDPVKGLLFDVAISVAIVALVALLLFAVSGIWPPLVAIESGSMEPNIQTGDLVFVVSVANFVPDGVDNSGGVVTYEQGRESGYRNFGEYGDPIVFRPDGSDSRTPIIHRAMYYVEEGETWEDANGNSHTADRSGFVTRGDANSEYDQVQGLTSVVDPDWVEGKAKYRIPRVGNVRLMFPF